jgi:hypothetical protein
LSRNKIGDMPILKWVEQHVSKNHCGGQRAHHSHRPPVSEGEEKYYDYEHNGDDGTARISGEHVSEHQSTRGCHRCTERDANRSSHPRLSTSTHKKSCEIGHTDIRPHPDDARNPLSRRNIRKLDSFIVAKLSYSEILNF